LGGGSGKKGTSGKLLVSKRKAEAYVTKPTPRAGGITEMRGGGKNLRHLGLE